MNHITNINAIEFWNELSKEDRTKLVSENDFWGGFSNYKFEYIPEELRLIIVSKIEDKRI